MVNMVYLVPFLTNHYFLWTRSLRDSE